MEQITHPVLEAFAKWKNKKLTDDVKQKALTVLEPYVQDVLDNKKLTEEQKQKISNTAEKFVLIIDKHVNTIEKRVKNLDI
jgi:hypothetical protein